MMPIQFFVSEKLKNNYNKMQYNKQIKFKKMDKINFLLIRK